MGTGDDDNLSGIGEFDEQFQGLGGADFIRAFGGNDELRGGDGDDALQGDGGQAYLGPERK